MVNCVLASFPGLLPSFCPLQYKKPGSLGMRLIVCQSCVLICGGATWHQVGSSLVISGRLQLLYSPWLPSNLHVVCTLHVLPAKAVFLSTALGVRWGRTVVLAWVEYAGTFNYCAYFEFSEFPHRYASGTLGTLHVGVFCGYACILPSC